MKPAFGLIERGFNTSFAPLCVLGHMLWTQETLAPLRNMAAIPMKTCDHHPGEKLLDAFLVVLAGYPSLYLLNTALRPDPILATAWHRESLAEQSNVSRTLDAVTGPALEELRGISRQFWRQHSQLATHDWRQRLVLDLDLTPLPASKNAEASTKGYMGKKTRPGGN